MRLFPAASHGHRLARCGYGAADFANKLAANDFVATSLRSDGANNR